MKNKILIAVTGGVSAYKAVDVMSAFKKRGFIVSAMATENGLRFVSENILRITANKYWKHEWSSPVHIEATNDIDIFLVVPATANIIAKIAYGIADDLVSLTAIALPEKCIKIICPAMNSRMLNNPVVHRNLLTIQKDGWKGLYPVHGMLACGTEGEGKLPLTKDIVESVVNIIEGDK